MASGKRDFGELSAKLEKHLERLPDYAQRAQTKLQKYFPPQEQNGRDGADETTGEGTARRSSPPEPPRPPAAAKPAKPQSPVDFAMVSEVRDKWAKWNEPSAKHERRKRRTSKAFALWSVLTLLAVLWAAAGFAGITGNGLDGFAGAINGIIATVLLGALSVRSGLKLRQLNRTEVAAKPVPASLPPKTSCARQPMERLVESEQSLADLLEQLGNPAHGAAAVPELSVEQAGGTATEAASALRGLAARIQAVERARDSAPESERAALDTAVRTLRSQLVEGVDGYGKLVAAAGRAVAASSGGVTPAKQALTDATDHLAGLAVALRELP